MKSVVVVVIDRLGAGHLGPYGNTWIETPHWNRLAARSMLAEFALTDSVDLPRVYRSFWQGIHAVAPDDGRQTLPQLAGSMSTHSMLITDDEGLVHVPGAESFDDRVILAPWQAGVEAGEVDQTEMARLFATAIDWLDQAREPFFLWVHSRGMDGPWDAPAEYREQLADEEDPVPPAFVTPPVRFLKPDYDPDELLGLQQAYGGQVLLVDLCLGLLCNVLDDLALRQETMLIVTSSRGYPLGEHRRVGACEPCLYSESIHVPWLLNLPDQVGAAWRTQEMIQPPDLFATIADWLGLEQEMATRWGRSVLPLAAGCPIAARASAFAETGGFSAFRTPGWLLHRDPRGCNELYVKPDDRSEVNEVSSLCPEAVAELSAAAAQFREAAENSQPAQLVPLPETLIAGLE
jgi:arylsulfatase A-like enzyme